MAVQKSIFLFLEDDNNKNNFSNILSALSRRKLKDKITVFQKPISLSQLLLSLSVPCLNVNVVTSRRLKNNTPAFIKIYTNITERRKKIG